MRSLHRARTLGSVLNNTAAWIIASIVLILVLSELGFSVTALVASAGIIGAALGFGAQSVVKDVPNGLFIVRAGEQWAAERALCRTLKDSLDQRQVDIPPLNRMVIDNRDDLPNESPTTCR